MQLTVIDVFPQMLRSP